MNTIATRRVLKARISRGWAHDSSHFSFYRQTPANQARIPFEKDEPVSWAETSLWAVAIVAIGVLLFFVLGLVA